MIIFMAKALNKYIPDKRIIKSLCIQNKNLIKEISILENIVQEKENNILRLKRKVAVLEPYKEILSELKAGESKDSKAVARNIEYVSKLWETNKKTMDSYNTLKKKYDRVMEAMVQLQIKSNTQ